MMGGSSRESDVGTILGREDDTNCLGYDNTSLGGGAVDSTRDGKLVDGLLLKETHDQDIIKPNIMEDSSTIPMPSGGTDVQLEQLESMNIVKTTFGQNKKGPGVRMDVKTGTNCQFKRG